MWSLLYSADGSAIGESQFSRLRCDVFKLRVIDLRLITESVLQSKCGTLFLKAFHVVF